MHTVDAQNLVWVKSPVTWVVIPGWADTIWSIEVMAPDLLSEVFLIDPPDCFPLVLYDLVWDLSNKQATQEGGYLILLIFLGIITLFDSLRKYLK